MRIPKAFISYSWDSDEHKEWVLKLAVRLRESGVEVILDRWHLNLGTDRLHFMEQSVAHSDRVLIIGTPGFAKKSANREGGVGWETSIVTAELADDLSLTKFIPVLREGNFKISFPSWLKGRLGTNLQGDPYSEDEFDKLLRELHEETLQAPPVGVKPSFEPLPAALGSHFSAKPFNRVESKDGEGRFRTKGTPLGAKWDQMPFATTFKEVSLADGPVVWLRVMPMADPGRTWSATELKAAGTQNGAWLLPFFGSQYWNLRAEDGFGIYNSFDPNHESAFGVAFAFATGEIWSVDTHLLSHNNQIYVADLFKEMIEKLPQYVAVLKNLGVTGPYAWEAGLSGANGMRLVRPNSLHSFGQPVCLGNEIKAFGHFAADDDPNAVLYPLLKKLYDQCGLSTPSITQVGVQRTLNQQPKLNAIAYSFLEKKGFDDKVKIYVRPTDRGNVFSVESVPGGETEGSKNQMAAFYNQKIRELENDGYTRMNAMNASGERQFD